MTRKDYIIIAEAIRDSLIDLETGIALPDRERAAVMAVATRLAIRLRSDNDRFDVARFMDAAVGPVA